MAKTHIKKLKDKKKQIIAGLTELAEKILDELDITINEANNTPNSRTIHARINKEESYEDIRKVIEKINYFPKEIKKSLDFRYKLIVDAG